MKASELLAQLLVLITQHGDRQVAIYNDFLDDYSVIESSHLIAERKYDQFKVPAYFKLVMGDPIGMETI